MIRIYIFVSSLLFKESLKAGRGNLVKQHNPNAEIVPKGELCHHDMRKPAYPALHSTRLHIQAMLTPLFCPREHHLLGPICSTCHPRIRT
jgi:hypothetical protein